MNMYIHDFSREIVKAAILVEDNNYNWKMNYFNKVIKKYKKYLFNIVPAINIIDSNNINEQLEKDHNEFMILL